MKTSLLVLSLLFTSTNAIDIKTAPPVKPDHTKISSSHESEKSQSGALMEITILLQETQHRKPWRNCQITPP